MELRLAFYGSPIKSFEGYVEGSWRYFLATPSESSWQLLVDGKRLNKKWLLSGVWDLTPICQGFQIVSSNPFEPQGYNFPAAVLWVLILLGFYLGNVGAERSSL